MYGTAEKPFSISSLTYTIRELLENTIGSVYVEGEISNFRRQASGHLYFSLKDEHSQLQVVMFRGDASRLGFEPKDGQLVVARGEITVYPPRGNYQLRATSLKPKGKGTLQEQFEALKRKLSAEGLFDTERKRPLPVFPRKVGIVTSPTGAAVRDFLHVLGRRCPRIDIQVFGVKVQGEGSADEIVSAIEAFNQRNEIDILVIARGGGSLEDLWSFNEEQVVRAITNSRIPTLSGVGHEIDFTLSDFAADLRAPTPSAAAEILSRSDAEWSQALQSLRETLTRETRDFLRERRETLDSLAKNAVFREPQRLITEWLQKLDEMSFNLNRSTQQSLALKQERRENLIHRWNMAHPHRHLAELRIKLENRRDQLRLLSPRETLKRGYAMVLDPARNILKTAQAAREQKTFHIQFSDGKVKAQNLGHF